MKVSPMDTYAKNITNCSIGNLTNTLRNENVAIKLIKDVQTFIETQDYYNEKGLTYARAYLM